MGPFFCTFSTQNGIKSSNIPYPTCRSRRYSRSKTALGKYCSQISGRAELLLPALLLAFCGQHSQHSMATAPPPSQTMVELPLAPSPDKRTHSRGASQPQPTSTVLRPDSPSKTPGFIERVQARVRPDEVYREEIVRSIFGDVGTPLEGDLRYCGGGGGGSRCLGCCYAGVLGD